MKGILKFSCLIIIVLFTACKKDVPVPKPRGYHRLQLPKLEHVKPFQMNECDFTFEAPNYVSIERDSLFFDEEPDHPCWLNINYPELNGTIYMSYKPLGKNNLVQLTEDYHKMKNKHVIKADFIDDAVISNPDRKLFGLISSVGGNVASSYQFYVTDSTKHYVRGSLYFKTTPNVDSLSPAIQFVRKDLLKMLETWDWKE